MNYATFEELFLIPLRNGVSYPASRRGAGIPMVNMGEAFRFDRISDQECERVPLTKAERDRYILQGGDLLFVRQSLKYEGAGKCIYVQAAEEARTWESHLIRVRLDPSAADPRYYFYYFRSPIGRLAVESIIEQVAAAGIRGSDLKRLKVPHPPVQTQGNIADVLSALDDKIAVNDHIADMAGNLASSHYAFSTQHADRSVVLQEIIDLRYGRALPEANREPGNVPVFGSNGRSGWHSAPLCSGPGIIVGRKGANAGSISWSQIPFWAIDTAFYVLPRSGEIPLEYLYFLLDRAGFRNLVGDSAIPGLNRAIALACRVALPPCEIIRQAASEIRPLLELQSQVSAESGSLAKLRDTLLPRLMSGEIRVREAERIVEDVT